MTKMILWSIITFVSISKCSSPFILRNGDDLNSYILDLPYLIESEKTKTGTPIGENEK